MRHLLHASSMAALIVGASTGQSWAQNENNDALTEIINVTARKREESIIKIPNAVTAISRETIQDLRLFDARDVLQLIPTAYLQENNAGTARDISIRGVSTPTLFAEPGVALYLDEVYSSGFISYPTQFRDIERVEVLRGPQGALYGRNAVGGAANVISKRPEDELGVRVRAVYGNLDRVELQGILNVPVSDIGGVRVTGWYDDQSDGEYRNAVTNEFLDDNQSAGGRFVGTLSPIEGLNLTTIVEYEDAEGPGTYLFFPDAGETDDTILRDTQPENTWEALRYSVIANYDSDIGTFSFVLGGRDYQLDGIEDTDLSNDTMVNLLTGQLGQQITTRTNEVNSFMAEARWLSNNLGPVQILAGVTYLNEDATGDVLTNLQGLSNVLAGGFAPFTLGIENDQSLKSFAFFAEVTVDITDRISLIASGRYTNDDKDVDFLFTPTPTLLGFVGPSQAANLSETFDNFSPGGALTFEATDTLNLYAKVQTGFRAGGFNFNVANAANLRYEQETSINYELGAKQAILDGGGYVAASIFLLNQDDVLVPVFDFTAPPGLQGFLVNAGEARTFGVEVEAVAELFEGFTLQASVGYLDGQFTSGAITNALGQQVNLDGLELPAARNWTGSVVAAYKTAITEDIDFVGNASFTGRSTGFQDTENNFEIEGNALLNLSAGIEFGGIQVLGFMQNVTDDRYEIAFGGFRAPNATGVTLARGRTYGIQVTADF